jgi:hypothetical protein
VVTDRASFTNDEWDHLVQLPRLVVGAASAAQHDIAYRTTREIEAGYIASANGRQTGNAFVTGVASDTMRIFDEPSTVATTDFTDREAGIVSVLGQVRTVNQLLKTKADVGDAMAYRRWLLTITDIVISAAKSGDFLGIGGTVVTKSEHRFRDRLLVVLQS